MIEKYRYKGRKDRKGGENYEMGEAEREEIQASLAGLLPKGNEKLEKAIKNMKGYADNKIDNSKTKRKIKKNALDPSAPEELELD